MIKSIKYILVWGFLFISFYGYSQQIGQIQYWTDNNFAGRITESVTAGKIIRLSELNVSTITEGIHEIHIRAKDNNGWSVVHSQLIYKLPSYSGGIAMKSYEYWVDKDYLNKKTGSLSGKSALISELDLKAYAEGIHHLHIRVTDQSGKFSIVHSQLFYKLEGSDEGKMKGYEYWVDDDLENKKTGVLTGKIASIDELNVDAYYEGIHLLHIRATDEMGRKSVVHSNMFYKFPGNVDVVMDSYEYWIDNDTENKKTATLTGKTAIINNLDITSYTEGIHLLHIRAKDKLGRYSPVHTQTFYLNKRIEGEVNKIDAYRYWFDSDNNPEITLIKTPSNPYKLNDSFSIPVDFQQGEEHTFNIQFRDLLGNWSVIQTDTFKLAGNVNIDYIDTHSVSVYPNPFEDHIYVSMNNPNAKMNMILTDLNGKQVYSTTINNQREDNTIRIDLPKNITRGMYIFHIEGTEKNNRALRFKVIRK